jgi:hypothetical protein
MKTGWGSSEQPIKTEITDNNSNKLKNKKKPIKPKITAVN